MGRSKTPTALCGVFHIMKIIPSLPLFKRKGLFMCILCIWTMGFLCSFTPYPFCKIPQMVINYIRLKSYNRTLEAISRKSTPSGYKTFHNSGTAPGKRENEREVEFMFIFLLVLWIILNGRLSVEVLVLGVLISGIICLFASKCMGYSFKKERGVLKCVPGFIRYCFLLLFEIIKANLDVMHLILSPRLEPEPQLIKVHIPLKTVLGRVVLANSITLTPGTITVDLEGDEYTIHCLDKELGEGIEDSSFVHRLTRLEETNE